MCEVTSSNFDEKYNQIIDDLHSALFIAIDCEFTGLFGKDYISLFDTPAVRFNKLQRCLEDYIIIQFGLTTFKYERKDNSFTASTYNFYLTPTSLAGNENIKCKVESIEFLSKHKFDFNKSFRDGIYYVNKSDESKVSSMIEDGSLINEDYSKEIQQHCSVISEWTVNAPVDGEMFLKLENERQTFLYLMLREIRKRFPHIGACFEKNGIKITKLKQLRKKQQSEEILLKKKIFESLLGFSRIMKEIQNLKKPIVGHNLFIDLIKIYQQFYNPVPVSYAQFKKAVNDLFPNLYDTKHMSFRLRELLTKEQSWKSNCLSDLYQYLKTGKGASLVIYTPLVNHTNEEYENGSHFHEAGFDSYATGFCFLKMAHAFFLWSDEKKSFHLTIMPTSSSSLLGATQPFKNQMNISRGQVNVIVMDGPDPKSSRPGLLYIRSGRNEPLNMAKISDLIARYGSVDIQPLNKSSALMAVANHRQRNEILQSFQKSDEFLVYKYNFLKHSPLGRAMLSGAIIASAVFAAIITLKGWRKV